MWNVVCGTVRSVSINSERRRTTLLEQRLYLHGVSERFTHLAKAAVEGNYIDIFFGNPHTAFGIIKRFRAVTQNSLISFAETMRNAGHERSIVDSTKIERSPHNSRAISREAFIDEVLPLMRNTRGMKLPRTYSSYLIAVLFYKQAQRWEGLTRSYISFLWERTYHTIIHRALKAIKVELDGTVSEILAPHQTGHPITYNHYFTENLQKLRQTRQKERLSKSLDQFFGTSSDEGLTLCQERTFDVRSLLNSLTKSSTPDMDRFVYSEAIDGIMAYYKVAMKTLVDDIAVLAVEKYLLKSIPELLTSRIVISLGDVQISAIAAESDNARAERALADKEHKVLTKARAMLSRLDQSRPGEVSVPESVPGLFTSRTWSNADVDSDVSSERPASSGTKSIEESLKTLRQDANEQQAESTTKLSTLSDKDSLVDDSVDAPESLDDFKWGSAKSASKRSKRQIKTFYSSLV